MSETFNPDTTTMMDAKRGYIPEQLSDSILTEVKNGSAIMKLAKAVPMTKPRQQFTFMSGVGAYWVGEGQKIETSKPTWMEAWMEAHKMAVIIPTTQENLDYSVTDFFSLMKAEIAEAFYKKFDQSVLFGNDSPFPQSVIGSTMVGSTPRTVVETANKYDDISKAMAFLEENDLDANGIAAPRSERVKYRSTLDQMGHPIFTEPTTNTPSDVLGLPIAWAPKGSWDKKKASEILADWNQVYYGILKGIHFDILTEATLTTIVGKDNQPINLAERDMSAIRATFSPAFMVIKDEAIAAVTPSGTTATANKEPARKAVTRRDSDSSKTDNSDSKDSSKTSPSSK